jgi:hypothetical protein
MTNRNLFLTWLFLLVTVSLPLPAQSGHYVIEQRYVRLIACTEDGYVLKYEVVLERDEGEGYRVFAREFTESPSLQISLLPGNYRYQVVPYDFLEQPGEASEWVILNVLPAPVISVEVRTIGDDNYLLLPSDGGQLVPGVNEIVIKNPDELKTGEGVITVEKAGVSVYDRRITVYLDAAWEPLLPLYGEMHEIFGSGFYGSGAALRLGATYSKLKWFSPGLELSASWYVLNSIQNDYTVRIQAGVIGLSVLAQKWLPNQKMAITLRAGGGMGFQTGELSGGRDPYSASGMVPRINLEPSFLWLALEQLYLEAGLGYTFFLNENGHSGCLSPRLGVGWNF